MKKVLENIANLHYNHYKAVIIVAILLSVFMFVGASKVYMESDITNEFPQDLPAFVVADRVDAHFGTGDSVLITFKLDQESSSSAINDIRDPYVIQSIMFFEEILLEETEVDSVTSAAMFFKDKPFFTLDHTKAIIEMEPGSKAFFNKDYTSSLMIVSASIGFDQQKIRKMIDRFEENKESTFLPPGVKVTVTGTPFITNTILTFLQQDAIFTTALAAIIILFVLFIIERSFTKGFLVFIPLTLGLLWTIGTLGWLGIPISVATVGVGAMILGLGVEYGVFVVSRYSEERKKLKQLPAMRVTLREVGSSISGSGITTIIGFLALTLSIMPMMQHLGQSLALGIFFSLIAAIMVNPALILLEEEFEEKTFHRGKKKLKKKAERMRSKA